MWNVTKQYPSRGGGEGIRMSTSYLLTSSKLFGACWCRHMQYFTFAMWMAVQSHQPLRCVCNIHHSKLLGRFPGIDKPSVMCRFMFSLKSCCYFFSLRSCKKKKRERLFLKEQTAHFAFICEKASCTVEQVLMQQTAL